MTICAHVKDVAVVRQNTGFYVFGTKVGEGMLPVPEFVRAISGADRDPDLLVECWMDAETTEEETISQEEDWIADGITFLKQLRQQTGRPGQ